MEFSEATNKQYAYIEILKALCKFNKSNSVFNIVYSNLQEKYNFFIILITVFLLSTESLPCHTGQVHAVSGLCQQVAATARQRAVATAL